MLILTQTLTVNSVYVQVIYITLNASAFVRFTAEE